MSSSIGRSIGEAIITALWPVVWVIYILLGLLVFVETAALYLSWGMVTRLDRVPRKTGLQVAG